MKMVEQLTLGKDGMNLGMADFMDEDGFLSLECLGQEVVFIYRRPLDHVSSTDGTVTHYFRFCLIHFPKLRPILPFLKNNHGKK